MVFGELVDDAKVITVQCDFIMNSNALGCMVVIVGEFTNITVNLTRGDKINSACTTVSNNNILNESLYDVFGFDIEFDNSVSSFLVPGVIERNNATRLTCDSGNASAIPMISRKLVEVKQQ